MTVYNVYTHILFWIHTLYVCIRHLNLHSVYDIIAFEILVHHGVVIIVDPGSCFLETEQAAWSMAEVSKVTIACLLRTRFVGYDASWQGPLGLVFSFHPALACNPCSSIFQMQLSDRVQGIFFTGRILHFHSLFDRILRVESPWVRCFGFSKKILLDWPATTSVVFMKQQSRQACNDATYISSTVKLCNYPGNDRG